MVARKSQRVKKSTVVYQSPEQVPRASRNVTPKTVPPRRSSNRDIELQMECVDDELSPAQLKAIKEAQKEHEKANDLIKEVRAGNILVPSSQPNTFTIVPPKPPPPPPQPPQPPAQHVQPLAAKVQSPPQDTGSQRGLPPPRPAQFLSKQLKEMNKAPGPRSSPDVILISDTPAMSATSKTMPATMHVSQVSGNQLQMQQVTTLLTSQGPGATPQQVYKFVSLPSNMPANVVQNQWALRPLLTVSPQQQSQMTFLTPTVTPRSGSQLVGSVPQGQGQMPAPRPTGKKLDKVGGAYLTDGRGVSQGSTVIQETYLKKYGTSRIKSRHCSLSAKHQHRYGIRLKNIWKMYCVCSKMYTCKVWLHCLRVSELFDNVKAKQAYNKSQVELDVWTSMYKWWFKSIRWKIKAIVSKSKKSPHEIGHSDSNDLVKGADETSDLSLNCDKVEHPNREHSGTVHVFSDFNKENKNPDEENNAHFACDKSESVYSDRQNCFCDGNLTIDMCQLLDEKTGNFSEPDFDHAKQIKSSNEDLRVVSRNEFEAGMSYQDDLEELSSFQNVSCCGGWKCEYQSAFVAYLGQQSSENPKSANDEGSRRVEDVLECTHHSEVAQKPVCELNDSAFQDKFLDFLTLCKASQGSDDNLQNVRNPLGELNHFNKSVTDVVPWREIKTKMAPCCEEDKTNLMNWGSAKNYHKSAKISKKDKENVKCFTKRKCKGFKKHKAAGKKKQSSLNILYETLIGEYIPRNFGIVNMVYESARHMACDSDNSTMRTADECSSVAESQLSDITNLSSGNAKEDEIEVEKVTSMNSGLNGVVENSTAELQVQRCVNQMIETVVSKENSCEHSELSYDLDTTELKENQGRVKVFETSKSQEENCNTCNSNERHFSESTEINKTELCVRKECLGDKVPDENIVRDEHCNKSFEKDDFWSDCSGEISSEDETELLKQEDVLHVKPMEMKEKWYKKMSMLDAMYVVVLCSHIGFTKVSRDLQIPKTELLKLRRSVKKSKYYQKKDFETSSETVGGVQKASKLSDPFKCNLVKSSTCQHDNDHKDCEASVLKNYHPALYKTAQTLLQNFDKTAESYIDKGCIEECTEKKEAKDIASEELQPCQTQSSVTPLGNLDLNYSPSVSSDSCTVDSRSKLVSTCVDNFNQVSVVRSSVEVSENSVIPNTCRTNIGYGVHTMSELSDKELLSSNVDSEKQAGKSDQQKHVSQFKDNLETIQACKFKGMTSRTTGKKSTEYVCERMNSSGSETDSNIDEDNLVIDFDTSDSKHHEEDMQDIAKRTDVENFTKFAGTQYKNCDNYSKDERNQSLKETDLLKLRASSGQSEPSCGQNEEFCEEKKSENCKELKREGPVNAFSLTSKDVDLSLNKEDTMHNHESCGLQSEDIDKNLVKINTDHCYEKTADAEKEIRDKHGIIDEVIIENDNDCVLEKHGALHTPLNDSLTYPQKTWEQIEGRQVNVFKPVSNERLDKIIKHASKLGLQSAAECYNIPEEHIQIFIYHALSCSKQNKANNCQRLESGIPADYVSSNFANEMPSKVYSEVISVDENTVDHYGHHTNTVTEPARQDILNKLRDNIQGKSDTNEFEEAELKIGTEKELNTLTLGTPLELKDGKQVIIVMGSCGDLHQEKNTVHRSGSVVSPEQKQKSHHSSTCSDQSKKVQKKQDMNKRTDTQGDNSEHPVFTKDFLQYFAENDLYHGFNDANDEEITEKHLKALQQIDIESNVKTFVCANGRERHFYAPELQRKLLLLASKIGLKTISNYFDLNFQTLRKWKKCLRKALENYSKDNVDKIDKSDGHAGKSNSVAQKKRVLLSRDLRIKIVHLCKSVGSSEVCKQYNLNSKTLRNWVRIFKDEKLTNYELTNEELVQLVDYGIYRSTIANGGTSRSTSSASLSSVESHEEKKLSLRIESVIGSNENSTDSDNSKRFEVEQEMQNGKIIRADKNIKENHREISKSKTDQSRLVTYPNNMEVILDIEEDVDESDTGSIINDLDEECCSPLDESPILSDSDCDSEADENGENAMIGKKNNEVIPVECRKGESMEEHFIDQNLSFIEAVNKELVLSESENEDVVEIVSWNVNSENEDVSDETNKNIPEAIVNYSECNVEKDQGFISLNQNHKVDNEKPKDEEDIPQGGVKVNMEKAAAGNESYEKTDKMHQLDTSKCDKNDVFPQDADDDVSEKGATGISLKENKNREIPTVSKEKRLAEIQRNSSVVNKIQHSQCSSEITYSETASEKSTAALNTENTTEDYTSVLDKNILYSNERSKQVSTVMPTEDNVHFDTCVRDSLRQNGNECIVRNNSINKSLENSQIVEVDVTDESCTFDGKNSSLKKPQLQMFSPIDIKDEPYDEEFDRIEKGNNFKRQNSDLSKKEQRIADEKNESGKGRKNNLMTGMESNAITSDNLNGSGSENSESKDCKINQLGTGDGSNSQAQGSTFQSSSGNNSSGSQGTAAQTNMSGNIPNIDLNINSLSTGSTNVQIVGTQDLIPGQEYIIVDPRLFSSGSNTFQNLRPPALLRPQVRSSVNPVNSVRPRLHVRGLVSSVPNTADPRPVHIVENRSAKIGTSGSSLQGAVPRPSLTILGNQSPSILGQGKRVSPGNQTVRSLLTGIQRTSSSSVSRTVVVNTSPTVYVPDNRNLSPGRSSLNTSPISGMVILHASKANKSPSDQHETKSKDAITQSYNELSNSVLKSAEGVQTPAHTPEIGNDKSFSFTLKGVGSISNENLAIPSTSGVNKNSTSTGNIEVQDESVCEEVCPREQFSKYVPNSKLLLEKERKLLQTLLLQKSGTNKASSTLDSSTNSVSKPDNKHCQMQSSNRIDSLIQKMTNRMQKGPDDYKMKWTLSAIGTSKSKKNETETVAKPCSASEILFGEHSSPKKKETPPDKELITKPHSVKSALFSGTERVASPGNSSSITKKDLRKSPLVTREIDSTEDESSTSSNTSESSTSNGAESSVENNEHTDGRIEHVDLSAKLKSLLSADIFNVIDAEKHDKEEDDDLIDILAKPSDSMHKTSTVMKHELSSTVRKNPDRKSQNSDTEGKSSSPAKKGNYINYSLNIKKKLGKLASMFSIVSLNKKYGISTHTLSKWKANYQDEEIAGLELTEDELKELEEVNKVKKSLYGSSEPEYDIYVDNPEEDDQDNEPGKNISREENMHKDKVEKRSVPQAELKQTETGVSKLFPNNKPSFTSKSSKPNFGKVEKGSRSCVKPGTPLYITIDDDASEEMKQQLRRNLKTQKTAEQTWSNGAFLETSKSCLASVFGTDRIESEKTKESTQSADKSKTVSVSASDTESASEKENDELAGKSQQRHGNSLDAKTSDSDNVTWEKTVYLCPDEGVFKYRYEKKTNQESTEDDKSEDNQTVSVLDSLFKSPAVPDLTTDTENNESKKQFNTSSSPATIAKMLKDTQRPTSVTRSTKNTIQGPLQTPKDKVCEEVNLSTATDEIYSENFKWTVVKEARKSGFEKTARWYNISMTDIMKWHDRFLHDKKSKEMNLPKIQSVSASESTSVMVDLTIDEDMRSKRVEPELTQTPGKGRRGSLNANLSFERIQVKEGAITKPRFNTKLDVHHVVSPVPSAAASPSNRPQRTRMGPNTIKYATPRVDPDQLQKFQADVQGDLGIMPKLMKKHNSKDGVEIASTWKQVQSVLKPVKPAEKRYSQEFKQKIITECEQKGQKTVAQEHRIPYNEISRWRLEAKKGNAAVLLQSSAFAKADLSKRTDSSKTTETVPMVGLKKSVSEPSSGQLAQNEIRQGNEQESLKIKIKLSSLSHTTPANSKKKTLDQTADLEVSPNKDISKPTGTSKNLTSQTGKKSSPMKNLASRGNRNESDRNDKQTAGNERKDKKQSTTSERTKSAERSEPISIDEDADLRMEVINFCFDQGVLKTQKKYNVTRQSIIDLMKEYDELNKYEVDNYNKAHGFHSFKTKLVSREKTSVEVTNTASQPVIVKNLNDYIVTQEYMKTVVDYALKHGITAASRKYKRKTNTVRSWMNQFQREVKKKISVEQIAKEQELIANNMSLEDARKISNLEARKKKQLLEAEFKRHIVEFARQFGITAASRRFKKKAATVKSWMGHFMKSERDAKRQEEAEARKKQSVDHETTKSPRQLPLSSSPERLSLPQDSYSQKSPSSNKQRTPPHSPIWEQDFIIKPSSSKSPLKLTFSPRRKSSPIVIGSSTEEDTVDETNDIETDDEQENVSGEYFEVAAWNLDSSDSKNEVAGNNSKKTDGSVIIVDDEKQNSLKNVVDLLSDEDISERNNSVNENFTNNSQHGPYTIVASIEKGSIADASSINANSEKSKTDHLAEDVLISPMDVPNIFDIDGSPSGKECMADREITEENDESEGNKAVKEKEDVLIIEHTEDETANANKTHVEEEIMKMPYEETVMFKLLTYELDQFMKDDSAVAKFVVKETVSSKTEDKIVVSKENKDNKPGPLKKFKKYADAEIMQNIEETYLFTGSRVTRNAAGKELQSNDGKDNKEVVNDSETENKIEDEQKTSLDENIQVQDHSEVSKAENKSVNLQTEEVEKETSDNEKVASVEQIHTDKPLDTTGTDNQKKGERSLFDILVSEGETSDNSNENDTEMAERSNISNEKKDEKKSPFSLFGNLMKNFKVPPSFGARSPTVSENGAEITEPIALDTEKGIGSPGKAAEVSKDRTERNLFDFICLEPESPKTPPIVSPPQTQSPRMQTRSLLKAGGSPASSPQKSSPVKVTPVKKPMFKFPKLALPVNFGNIAKLGMAKIKEEKTKDEKDTIKPEEIEIEGSVKEGDATTEEVNARDERKKLVTGENDKVEIDTKEETKTDIVMETFEELRQRLARERAAIKLEKEKSKVTTNDTEKVDEIDGTREDSTNITPSESAEIDSEMYKDFTPQKIVLILDISKKHGIEFASTSFGLPVSVIVNWIFEKDRKQRKAALSVSLEEKLKSLKKMKDGEITREDVKEQHCVDDLVLIKWESEFGWMVNNKSVCDVLEKWQKVETVTNINFDECVKNLERKDSVVEKEQNEDKAETTVMSEKNDLEIPEISIAEADISAASNEEEDIVITKVEKHSREEITEVSATENDLDESNADGEQRNVPEMITFVKTTRPRDFTIEQKAMFVLLVEKYGNQMINRKFGINTGTLHNWRYSSKPIRQYLYEQGHSFKIHSDGSNTGDKKTEKELPEQQVYTFNPADYMPVRETRSTSDKKTTESSNATVKSSETLKLSKETAAKPVLPQKAKRREMDPRLEEDLIDHPKGYRIISPTKLPPILRDARRGQTKDYTLEQRVAIVKLVQLYGVRTIHKQFRIPAGSIWNWQHAKNVIDILKKEEESEKESQAAQRELDFDEENEEDEDTPITIDTILDRVLIASETVNHLNFNLDQKADVVCLINHFGIDYFCEKVPQIPRGTLWNWRHNRHVIALVEKRNELIKKFSDILNGQKGKGVRENVVGEAVDRTDLTQKWLKDLQDNVHDKRRLSNQREGSVESNKRKRDDKDEIETHAKTNSKKKPKLGPMCYKRSLANDRNHRRSLSPSTVSSEISVHSDDFEEILSDDELNTPSVVSKRSGTSTQTVQSNKTNRSQQRTSKGMASGKFESGLVSQSSKQDIDKSDENAAPVHEIIKFESGQNDRMMVCYKVLENSEVASKYVKIDNQNLTIKRPSPNELAASQPAAKKKNPKVAEISDQSGNWIPLDEYYYGTHDGDASYTEEKGEYRFKCWYCSKMLYNNVRAMQHIQGHIDASKQQNIDLSDLTQCKHCYKQFDTPFEMQTHVEKVHLSNKVLMCRICEKDFSTPRELTVHMKGNHHACEMPYVCHLCNFKSSMYSDVVDHFKKKHDSSHYMLCLYCLRTFEVKFVSQGWGQTQTYYGHLLKHQTKSATKKCVVCRLTFFNAQDVKNHRKNCHVGNFKDVKALTSGSKTDSGQKQKKGSSLKSLNAPSVSRIQDYGEIIFPAEASNTKCVECKMLMSSTDHYKKYVHCSMCRFATSCSVAYANHMMGFHSGQMSSLNLNIPWERPMKEIMYCACGFNSKYGNKIANHLVYCAKRTCYTTKRTQSDTTTGSTGDEKKEGSILGMLGLVQKSVVATKIRSKPKLDTKSGLEEPNKIRESKVKANISELKSEDKTDTVDTKEKSEEKESRKITDVEDKPITVSETTKPSDKEDEKPIDISSSSEESFMDKSNLVDESDKVIEISEKEKPEEQADITEAGKEEEVSENLKSKHEKEVIDADIGCEQIKSSEDAQLETDTQSVQDKRSSATEKEKEVIKDIEEVMDTERVNEPDENSEDAQPPKMGAGMIPSEDELASKDDSTLAKDEENDMDTKETETQESLKAKNDSVAMEESESLNENVDDSEMDTLLEAVESPKPILETKDESDQKETSDFKQSELGNSGMDSVSEETGNVDSLENEKEELELTTERTEELTEPPIKTDEKGGEDEAVEEKDTEESKEEQDLTDSSEEKEKPKEEEKPPEDTEPKEQEKPKEIESTSQKESCDHGDSRTSSGDHKDPSDRRSQERPDDRRDSSDRHSQERPGDRRDSSDHHSKERYDSRDRPHSGSSDRSRHDDKSRQEDRHRQENRSYGSSRSDSYHGNRSSYDLNRDRDRSYDRDRDRDRSYDRDRDRDYNRNRDYRHGDSRSGHGYQDNRGQGYRGQGQYGGYQGNRGGHHQDRNFNRNYQNRGGYNQNYRGGYRGGFIRRSRSLVECKNGQIFRNLGWRVILLASFEDRWKHLQVSLM
ncbi:uncharacterized protein LOC123541760 isoform X2 [Mercenaria mercenaria]|uniref:uncharacterized protein LOC123541760 isoform X2 n=1 Tax=Mercenaria mercenaria TaxID=6596 RepID=UPI00234EC0E1|nr:uncharacterized protein LOC123541760 isoform X2 [Mercenaria mercenaria]